MKEPDIRVGILTDGAPVLEKRGKLTHVANLLIGDGFHWRQSIEADFEGQMFKLPEPQGHVHLINKLPLERYLMSVTGSEMNPNAPLEFLKAHAIISRSWAMGKLLRSAKGGRGLRGAEDGTAGKVDTPEMIVDWMDACDHEGFDVCSDDHCQRYQGIVSDKIQETRYKIQDTSDKRQETSDKRQETRDKCVFVGEKGLDKLTQALKETRGMVLTDRHGRIADARFSKCCGGKTEKFSTCWKEKSVDYLRSLYDPFCDLTELDEAEKEDFLQRTLKNYDRSLADPNDWTVTVTLGDITRWVREKFHRNIGDVTGLEIAEKTRGGRVKMLRILGTEGELTVGKELMVRRALSESHLYSAMFNFTIDGDLVTIHGHGWGHGVGLCQIGAARMADLNYDFRDILEFYYPHSKLTKLYE